MEMEGHEEIRIVRIDENDVAQFLYPKLVELGYAVSSDEILDVATLVIDFLIHIEAFDGIDYIEED
jgi:hypothetical protein